MSSKIFTSGAVRRILKTARRYGQDIQPYEQEYYRMTNDHHDLVAIEPCDVPFFMHLNLESEKKSTRFKDAAWIQEYAESYNKVERTMALEDYAFFGTVPASMPCKQKPALNTDEPLQTNDDSEEEAASTQQLQESQEPQQNQDGASSTSSYIRRPTKKPKVAKSPGA